jgi:hypothetical protein
LLQGRPSRVVKTLILSALICEFLQVLLLLAFTVPLRPDLDLLGGTALLSGMSFRVIFLFHQSVFYHSLAAPFIAILLYVTLLVFNLSGFAAECAVYSVTIGFMLAVTGGMTTIFVGWNLFAHGVFLLGLLASFVAGVFLLATLNPFAIASKKQAWRSRLVRLNIWIAVLFVLATAVVGAYASMGSSQWGASAIIDEFVFIRSAHEHAIITIVDAAIVVIAAEHFEIAGFGGLRRFSSDVGMYSMLIGIPTVAIATYASVPFGVAAHNVITAIAVLLLQGALFVTYAMMADIVLRPGRGSTVAKLFRDPLVFGLLFTFLWVNVAVSLPGIYVAVHLRQFAGLPNEVPFIRGHEHALVTITAMALLLLVGSIFNFKGRARILIGSTITAGYVIGLGAAVPYIFLNPDLYAGFAIRFIQIGIVLMLAGVLATILAAVTYLRRGRV